MRRPILVLILPAILSLSLIAPGTLASGLAAEAQTESPKQRVERLLLEMGQADKETRCRALAELADLGDAALPAFDTMLNALQDEAPEVRVTAAVALGRSKLRPEEALPAIFRLFDDAQPVGDREVWFFAGLAVGGYGEAAVPTLIEVLKQDGAQQRKSAAIAICELGPKAKDVLPALIEALRSSDVETRRPWLMNAMLRLGPEAKPALPLMLEYLDDEDFHTQYWACRVLGEIGPDANAAVPKLVSLLKDGVASVRRNAAAALGKIGPGIGDEARDALIAALKEFSQPVREQAAIALGRLGPFAKPAVPTLEEVLKDDSNLAAKSRTAEALHRLDPDSPTPLHVLLVQVQGEDEAEVAARVLGEIGNELGAADRLTELLDDPKTWTRIHVAWALGLMGKSTERAIAVLEGFLDDPEPDYSNEARVALGEIRNRQSD